VRNLIFILACTLALSACNSHRVSQFPSYKLTIEQGNELDEKALSQLQPGLSKAQVRSLLGSPLLTDIFHADRWDYVFMVSRNGVIHAQADLTLFFEGDALKYVEGDALDYLQSQTILKKFQQKPKTTGNSNE
jgi:outer membrane protein assembly factor BamE